MEDNRCIFVLENDKFSYEMDQVVNVYLQNGPWGDDPIAGTAKVVDLKPTEIHFGNGRGRVECTETTFEFDEKAATYYPKIDVGFSGMHNRLFISDAMARMKRIKEQENKKKARVLAEPTPHRYACGCGLIMTLNKDVEDMSCPVCEDGYLEKVL